MNEPSKRELSCCNNAGSPHKINQHLLRKLWISTAINLNTNQVIVKILSFKAVPEDVLTYFLNRAELREVWQKVIDALPLEPRANGRVTDLQEFTELLARALVKLIEKERGRPWGAMMGILAKGKLSEKEYLEQYLKEE